MHRYPDSPVFYRNLAREFPLAVRGEGCWIEDETGKRYLDAVGGAFVACIGHGVREIGDAMAQQAGRIAYVSGAAFTNEGVEALAANSWRERPAWTALTSWAAGPRLPKPRSSSRGSIGLNAISRPNIA
jgi:adenosylmethionine-8-amino-7-oxononanoate aminotransferase